MKTTQHILFISLLLIFLAKVKVNQERINYQRKI